jgi:hypothetical protein
VLAICDRIKERGSPKMALHTRKVVIGKFSSAA